MVERRALLIAPLYGQEHDGFVLPMLSGGSTAVERLRTCLETYGDYDVNTELASTFVRRGELRRKLQEFFDCRDGCLLLYFYGHGCLRGDAGVLVTSDAEPGDEGVEMRDVIGPAMASEASEVVFILDCCHAGAARSLTPESLQSNMMTKDGRAVIVACQADQEGVEVPQEDVGVLSRFSALVIEGLEGKAAADHTEVSFTRLAEYVKEQMNEWGQSPVYDIRGAGKGYSFVVTRGFVPGVDQKAFCALFVYYTNLIEEMKLYKTLHDLFQDLEFSLRSITSRFTRELLENDPQAWQELECHVRQENDIFDTIAGMRANVDALNAGRVWDRKLGEAESNLAIALKYRSYDELAASLTILQKILPKQSIVNVKLCETANDLPLPDLIAELKSIHEYIGSYSRDHATVDELGAEIEHMIQLKAKVQDLTSEHDLWQTLDDQQRLIESELRQIEVQIRTNQDAIRDCAHRIKLELTDLEDLSGDLFSAQAAEWIDKMQKAFAEIQFGFGRSDVRIILSAFDTYRSLGFRRFKKVDQDLLEVCGTELPAVASKLAKLLERICGRELPGLVARRNGIGGEK